MNNLFNETDVKEMIGRIERLAPGAEKQWGKMNAAQMLAHCNKSIETAMGKNAMNRLFIGRIIGSLMKRSVLSNKPFGKNSPTDKSYIFPSDLDFEKEKRTLISSLKSFYEGGAANCTKAPHPFFGYFTPDEWSVFQWKHLDHHLRQFGV